MAFHAKIQRTIIKSLDMDLHFRNITLVLLQRAEGEKSQKVRS